MWDVSLPRGRKTAQKQVEEYQRFRIQKSKDIKPAKFFWDFLKIF